jgi:hypothetical protein
MYPFRNNFSNSGNLIKEYPVFYRIVLFLFFATYFFVSGFVLYNFGWKTKICLMTLLPLLLLVEIGLGISIYKQATEQKIKEALEIPEGIEFVTNLSLTMFYLMLNTTFILFTIFGAVFF